MLRAAHAVKKNRNEQNRWALLKIEAERQAGGLIETRGKPLTIRPGGSHARAAVLTRALGTPSLTVYRGRVVRAEFAVVSVSVGSSIPNYRAA